ncbi:phage tail protein [Xenorhabdus bovienii]|uniref:phage tail fiber protein n=1 Tax=Xenorhabdus bovienii TaxID=40576 RepID=UPI001EDFAC8B|nr:tail fiber protein [Xenorhabdus bovienii]MCG3472495.1 phage tail protein [Xenorhabdus bovienii]
MQDKKPDTITLDEDNLVVVPTPKYVKDSIEEHAQSRNHPNATLEDKGFVILSNDVGSDSETNAATPKAVKAAYDLANTANRNADTRLAKDQNGADIPNKEEFVKNIGLAGTVELAKNAVSANGGNYPGYFRFKQVETLPTEHNAVMLVSSEHRPTNSQVAFTGYGWYNNYVHTGIVRGGGTDTAGYAIDINGLRLLTIANWGLTLGCEIFVNGGDYGGVSSVRSSGNFWKIEGAPDSETTLLNFIDRNPDRSNRSVQSLPKGFGTIMSTSQYYADKTGVVRKYSPTILIHPDGQFETNDESEGATVQRLSEGVYLIKNVLGFNADGAMSSIEIPQCQNKLPLIWVNHEILPDGTIKLMTYHREHPNVPAFARNEREGYSDGDLIDIPSGRFVSVRVQIPATEDDTKVTPVSPAEDQTPIPVSDSK